MKEPLHRSNAIWHGRVALLGREKKVDSENDNILT